MVLDGKGRRKREEERERVKRERRREKRKWKRRVRRRPMFSTSRYIIIKSLAKDAHVRAFAVRGDRRRAMLVISRASHLRKI